MNIVIGINRIEAQPWLVGPEFRRIGVATGMYSLERIGGNQRYAIGQIRDELAIRRVEITAQNPDDIVKTGKP